MDPQNQKNNPDYDFILNRTGPELPRAKHRSKLVALVAVVVIIFIFGLATLVPNKKPKTQSTAADTNGQAVESFMAKMASTESTSVDDAAQLVQLDPTQSESFTTASLRRVQGAISFESCQRTSQVSDPNSLKLQVNYDCKSKSGKSIGFQVQAKTTNGQTSIITFSVVPVHA